MEPNLEHDDVVHKRKSLAPLINTMTKFSAELGNCRSTVVET
jgi:hypothetical protein